MAYHFGSVFRHFTASLASSIVAAGGRGLSSLVFNLIEKSNSLGIVEEYLTIYILSCEQQWRIERTVVKDRKGMDGHKWSW
jgi:hypothetical protein